MDGSKSVITINKYGKISIKILLKVWPISAPTFRSTGMKINIETK